MPTIVHVVMGPGSRSLWTTLRVDELACPGRRGWSRATILPARRGSPRESCIDNVPQLNRGRRERRVHGRTRGLAWKRREPHEHSHHRFARQSGIPCANGFTVSFVLSLVSRALLPPSPAERLPPTSHQRRDVRTTRLRRPRSALSSVARPASIASRLTFRDDSAYAPLAEAGQRESIKLFLPNRKAKNLSPMGWTDVEMLDTQNADLPVGQETSRQSRHCERQRSNPEPKKNWMASSLSLLAITEIVGWAKRSVPTIHSAAIWRGAGGGLARSAASCA